MKYVYHLATACQSHNKDSIHWYTYTSSPKPSYSSTVQPRRRRRMSLLFPAKFAVHGFVQFWYGFQATVAGGMGLVGFFYPNTPAITIGGYWQYMGETLKDVKENKPSGRILLAPNARGWCLRNAFAGVVNVMALYFGSKECYYIMAAVAIWREFFDILEAFLEGDTDKVFFPAKTPPGKFPPLPYFPPWGLLMVGNLASLYLIYVAQ